MTTIFTLDVRQACSLSHDHSCSACRAEHLRYLAYPRRYERQEEKLAADSSRTRDIPVSRLASMKECCGVVRYLRRTRVILSRHKLVNERQAVTFAQYGDVLKGIHVAKLVVIRFRVSGPTCRIRDWDLVERSRSVPCPASRACCGSYTKHSK